MPIEIFSGIKAELSLYEIFCFRVAISLAKVNRAVGKVARNSMRGKKRRRKTRKSQSTMLIIAVLRKNVGGCGKK